MISISMAPDEKEMQAQKIRLIRIGLIGGVLFAFYIIWRVETLIMILNVLK